MFCASLFHAEYLISSCGSCTCRLDDCSRTHIPASLQVCSGIGVVCGYRGGAQAQLVSLLACS